MTLAADFVESHPRFYETVVRAMFDEVVLQIYSLNAPDIAQHVRPLLAKWFQRFAHIGVKHSADMALTINTAFSFYKIVSVAKVKVTTSGGFTTTIARNLLLLEECLQEFVDLLPQMPLATQRQIWQSFAASNMSVQDKCQFLRLDLLECMPPEAKSIFTEHIASLAESELSKFLTVPILEHFGHCAKLKLVTRASAFKVEVKTALLHMVSPVDDDSDDCF